jgi:hypothetical protein
MPRSWRGNRPLEEPNKYRMVSGQLQASTASLEGIFMRLRAELHAVGKFTMSAPNFNQNVVVQHTAWRFTDWEGTENVAREEWGT